MPLTSNQAILVIDALQKAFDLAAFRRLLRDSLNLELDQLTHANRAQPAIADVVARADNEGWILHLVNAARESHPSDPNLQIVAARLGIAPRLVVAMRPKPLRQRAFTENNFEQILRGTNSMLEVADFRARLNEVEYQVCRLEIDHQPVGTGFLIGADLLLTCYHVVEDLIQGKQSATDLVARFDFKIDPRQVVANPGREFKLALDWLIDWSPYNLQEAEGLDEALPAEDELDYAVLRLDSSPGSQPISETSTEERTRGWVELSQQPYTFPIGSPLIIVQHPAGSPMKLAIDTQAILSLNLNQTRVRYRTNTQPGASGSPCFNNLWQLVALHHRGIVKYNEGIPTHLIASLLAQRGKWHLIGQPASQQY